MRNNRSIKQLRKRAKKPTSSPGLFSLYGGFFNFYCYCF